MHVQGAAVEAVLPVIQRITSSTCSLAYRLSPGRELQLSQQPLCSLKCTALGRHLVVAGSITGSSVARHVTLSAQQEQRSRGSPAGARADLSQQWEAFRPLWVQTQDVLARPLLADAAAQGLCAPPTGLLALDAEALDTILQQLPVRFRFCFSFHSVQSPARLLAMRFPT